MKCKTDYCNNDARTRINVLKPLEFLRRKDGGNRVVFFGSEPEDDGLCFSCFRQANESEFLAGRREVLRRWEVNR